MRRVPVLLPLATLLTACAADQHAVMHGSGFAKGADSHASGSHGSGAAAAIDATSISSASIAAPTADTVGSTWQAAELDLDQLGRELRTRLATAEEPAPAAIELAALLADVERHEEALAVLAAARRRSSNPTLRIAQAGVLRDLGKRHLAVAELRALCRQQGALALHPGLLFELAELQWLEGETEAAKATLSELQKAHANHAWCQHNASSIRSLSLEITSQPAPSCVRIRDLLGNLRGAGAEIVRLRTLEELVGLAQGGGDAPQVAAAASLRDLHERVIAIGCGDDSPAVRARAIQLARPAEPHSLAFFQAALADPSPLVRQHAAAVAAEQLGKAARPMLLASLEQESDEAAFLVIHEALAAGTSDPPNWQRADFASAERRAATVQAWRQLCGL